jgi:hypothetical protein
LPTDTLLRTFVILQIVFQTQVALDGDEYLGFLVQGDNDIATTNQVGNVLGVRELGSSAVPAVGETRTVAEWVDRRVSLSPDVRKLISEVIWRYAMLLLNYQYTAKLCFPTPACLVIK